MNNKMRCIVRVSTEYWVSALSQANYKRSIRVLKRQSEWDAIRDCFDDCEIDMQMIINLHSVKDGVYELYPICSINDTEVDEWELIPVQSMECES